MLIWVQSLSCILDCKHKQLQMKHMKHSKNQPKPHEKMNLLKK